MLLVLIVVVIFVLFGFNIYLDKRNSSLSSYCPFIEKKFCKGKEVIIEGVNLGTGYQVPPSTSVKAVFDGQVKPAKSTLAESLGGGQLPVLVLRSKERNFEISYYYQGEERLELKNVVAGEEIFKTSNETLLGTNYNLILRVRNLE